MEKDMNFCKFDGKLAKKPVLRGNEKKYAYITIACERDYQSENGKTSYDYVNLKLWKDPEKVVEELQEEQRVKVEAHYKSGSYTNDNGEKVYTNDLIIDKIDYDLQKEKTTKKTKEKSSEVEK